MGLEKSKDCEKGDGIKSKQKPQGPLSSEQNTAVLRGLFMCLRITHANKRVVTENEKGHGGWCMGQEKSAACLLTFSPFSKRSARDSTSSACVIQLLPPQQVSSPLWLHWLDCTCMKIWESFCWRTSSVLFRACLVLTRRSIFPSCL